ncbi:MAG TPA: transposase [Exilispira sp.]|nr:transposase [Exilispira sp.]
MTNTEKQTSSFMQEKLSRFANRISQNMSRPVAKFVRDMLFGICGTGTASIFNIAKHTKDKTSTKKTSERLYRNMGREGLDAELQAVLLDMVSSKIKRDSLIIVDESDIEKPYARKMEGLKLVHNGSKSIQTKGYNQLNIVACVDNERGCNLLPVCSDLISTDLETDSIKQILQDRLIDIAIKCGGKGIYVFDRAYDDRKMIGFLVENNMRFIIRGMGVRNIREGCEEKNFEQVVKDMKFQYELPGFKSGETFRCATRRIGVRTDDHPSKQAASVELSLVVVRKYIGNRKKGKDFYLLCNFADEKMTEAQIIQEAINNYRKRWKIEEVHRQMKQDLGWESIRLASYTKLKNLNMFLTLALYFIYSCKEIITKLAVAFPKIICYQTKDWAKLQQFIYYRISQVLQICYRISRHYDTSPYRADLIEPWQRKIRLV